MRALTVPAITVLMPVKEYHPRYLREALDSLLAQTSDSWRLEIITERGKRDELRELVGGYLEDSRCELLGNFLDRA